MNRLNVICLKAVRWSSWPLLPVIGGFLFTGYAMTGEYGLSRVCDEKTALTFHRLMHWPLMLLVLVHSVPAIYLAFQRWRWFGMRNPKEI